MLALCCYLADVLSNVFAPIMKIEIENGRDLQLEDVNDNSPEFLQALYNTSVSEVGYGQC